MIERRRTFKIDNENSDDKQFESFIRTFGNLGKFPPGESRGVKTFEMYLNQIGKRQGKLPDLDLELIRNISTALQVITMHAA